MKQQVSYSHARYYHALLEAFELGCALIAGGLWYTQGGAVWYTGGRPGPWPCLLLAIGTCAHLLDVRFSIRLRIVDVFIFVFLATALLGVWVAYDPGPAWAKLWLIVGAIGIYYGLAHQRSQWPALVLFGVFGVGLCLYFYTTNDWASYPAKVPLLVSLGRRISTAMPSLVSHQLSPNVAGSLLALTLPLYVPLVNATIGQSRGSTQAHVLNRLMHTSSIRKVLVVLWIMAACVCFLTLVISSSRGAWIALLSVTSVWTLWRVSGNWRILRRLQQHPNVKLVVFIAAGIVGLALVGLLAGVLLSERLPGSSALTSRLDLLQEALLLARDYLFTGAGLGMFQMQFSIYVLLIHVGFSVHAHNLFMDVLIEQGIFGLLSFSALLIATAVITVHSFNNASRQSKWMIEAALASLGVIVIHGLVDDTFFGSRGLLLLFAPLGMIVAQTNYLTRVGNRGVVANAKQDGHLLNRNKRAALALAMFAVVITVCLAIGRPALGAFYANLGAVEQSRLELSTYQSRSPGFDVMDTIRRQSDMQSAIAWFDRAIIVAPSSPTARQRLTEIAMARGHYAEALSHMLAAWNAGERDITCRSLLGDAYAANGQPMEAAQTVHGLAWASERLAAYAYSRYWQSKDYQRAADTWAAVVILQPDDIKSIAAQAEAARLAAQGK